MLVFVEKVQRSLYRKLQLDVGTSVITDTNAEWMTLHYVVE